MRETIGGIDQAHYWRCIAVLLLFAGLAFALGTLLRQRLGNLARLLNRDVGDTGLFVSEDVQILGSRRRLSQITQALTNRERFREKSAEHALWFDQHQVQLRQVGVIVSIFVTVILAVVAVLSPDAKSTVLGLWGVLCLLLIAYLVALEYIKQNIRFAEEIGELPDTELRESLIREEQATHSNTALDDLTPQAEKT